MNHKLQPARGTKDILGEDFIKFSHIQNEARRISSIYGFKEIATPIFEFTSIFAKTLGEESDVVGKEMYSFEDRGGENITLRPEFTAGIARSFISNGLSQQLPLKLFSTGPLFRYERPQKGRMRQFHQINFEMLGLAEPMADVELISMANQILTELNIQDKIKLEINSLGDDASRLKYRTRLVEYFSDYKDDLSEDSQVRLTKNPMRILDSKNEGDKNIVQNAPIITESFNQESVDFYGNVKNGLDLLNIPYQENSKLVRGLDYYCHTAFEFTTDALGSQNAVLAGGRYDKLIKKMGGQDTPAVGFAGGVERLVALTNVIAEQTRPVVIIPIGEIAEKQAFIIADILRKENIYTELSFSGNMKKRMKKANNINARLGIIFGEGELKNKTAKIKDFDSSNQIEVSTESLIDAIKETI